MSAAQSSARKLPSQKVYEEGADQETVLAVEITREGFDDALRHACLSHYAPGLHPDRATWKRALRQAPARVQWDPERDLRLNPLPYRSLQLGLSGDASRAYADDWTVSVRDVTPLAHEIHALVREGAHERARGLLPRERPYPAGDELLAHLRQALRPAAAMRHTGGLAIPADPCGKGLSVERTPHRPE